MDELKADKNRVGRIVKEAIANSLDLDLRKIKDDSVLKDDLGMDSFGAVELVYELKDKFNIEIPQEDFLKIKTVNDIVDYIATHLTRS
jgi:acyl carrier protein